MAYVISWLSVALFNVSMLSGLIVAFVYKPDIAYASVQKLTYLIPYGNFFRELHYFSSEAFLVAILLHVILEILKIKINIDQSSWNYSLFALLLLFFLMFTGYVLKADLSGLSAGEVSLSLLKQTPLLDNFLPLFQDNSMFVWKFYLWHILFLPILLTYAVYVHVKDLKTKYFIVGIGITVFCMVVFAMPKDIPLDTVALHVEGPWFFLGAENLLMLGMSPMLVDVVIAFPFLLLIVYYYFKNYRVVINYLLLIWAALYAYFSFI
jgi:ubiquinol-cytochrome c reductase cytochrome b subunit